MATDATKYLEQTAAQLKQDAEVRTTPRKLLDRFGYKRRGEYIVQEIRGALKKAGVTTEPDFDDTWFDGPISFKPVLATKNEQSKKPSELEEVGQASDAGDLGAEVPDPSYKISRLEAARKAIVSVKPDTPLREAVTLMLTHGFSQLAVMTSPFTVKGMITWASIGTHLTLSGPKTAVRETMEDHQEVRHDASMFAVISIIDEHQYVLVRGADSSVTGIVTASDLNHQFELLAEPFLLLREIESHVRRLIGDRIPQAEVNSVRDPEAPVKGKEGLKGLTLGELIRLVEKEERWNLLGFQVDRATFCKQLDQVRRVRNDVMHFDSDTISGEDLSLLRDLSKFLRRLQALEII